MKKRLRSIIVGLLGVAFTAASAGFLVGRSLPDSTIAPLVAISIASALLLGAVVMSKWCLRRMEAFDKERLHMMRGAEGESSVARVLATLPRNF